MALKDLEVRIEADTSEFQKGLKDIESGLKKMKSGLAGVSKGIKPADDGLKSLIKTGLGLAAVKKGIDTVWSSFRAFTAFEGASMRVDDLFGSSSSAIEQFAKGAKDTLGMSKAAAIEYAAVYGNLFKNITSGTRDNASITMSMLKASAVVSSKTGRTMEDVMERIRSGLLGNTEAIEDLGIYAQVGAIEATDAFKKIANGRSWDKLGYQEQMQIRTLSILEQAYSQYGTEVSQTSALTSSAFSGALKDLTVSFGALTSLGVIPILKGLTGLFTGLTLVTDALYNTNTPAKVFLGIALASAVAIPLVSLAIKGLALAKLLYSKVLSILIVKQWTFAAALKASFGWIGLIAGALGILWSVFGVSNKSTEDANAALANTKDTAGGAADKVNDLADGIKNLDKSAKRLSPIDEINTLGSSGGLINNVLGTADLSGLNEALTGIYELQTEVENLDLTPTISVPTSYGINQWWKDVKTLFTELSNGNGFKGFWSNWWNGIKIIGNGIKEKSGVEQWWKDAKTLFTELSNGKGFKGFWSNWWNGIKIIGNGIKEKSGVEQWWKDAKTLFTELSNGKGFKGFWSNWWNGIKIIGNGIKEKSGVDQWWKDVQTLFTELSNGKGFKGFWSNWWDGIKIIGNSIKDFFGGGSATSSSTSTFSVPAFATGGVVSTPTIAMIGEAGKEAVVPLENNTGWINKLANDIASAGGSGGDINVTMPIYLEGVLTDTIVRKINRRGGQGGQRVVPVG